jgi:hypothetical protein
LATRLSIWDLAVHGWSVIQSGWSGFMDGKEVTLVGEIAQSATITSEKMPAGVFSQGVTWPEGKLRLVGKLRLEGKL